MALQTAYADVWTQYNSNMALTDADMNIKVGVKPREIAYYNLELIWRVLKSMPFYLVPEVLDGAPNGLKVKMWGDWAKDADISGYTVQSVLSYLSEEPPAILESILKQWIQQVDLKNYGIADVGKAAIALHSHDDVVYLWRRWAESADLRVYSLERFARAIKDQSPEVQGICMLGYLRQVNAVVYPEKIRKKVIDHLPIPVQNLVWEFVKIDAPSGYRAVWRSVTATNPQEAVQDYLSNAKRNGNVLGDLQVQQYRAGWAVFEPKGA